MKKPIINEECLFKKLPDFFERPGHVLLELAQNSERAGATDLKISLEGNVLTASDNGAGLEHPESMLILAMSDWQDERTEMANPAGWGLYYLMCLSKEVFFKSIFGSLKVDCEKFFESAVYRSEVLNGIDEQDKGEGFVLRAVLKDRVEKSITSSTAQLGYFPFDITIKDEPVKRRDLAEESRSRYSVTVLEREYQGNKVYIRIANPLIFSPAFIKDKIKTIWYGIPIANERIEHSIFMDVKTGSPLTPVLPYRTTIKEDEKLESFCEFLRATVAEYCLHQINNPEIKEEITLHALMQIMETVGLPEEINALDRFYVTVDQLHHRLDDPLAVTVILHRNDSVPINETLSTIVVKYTTKGGKVIRRFHQSDEITEDLVLPEGAIKEVTAPNVRPDWLQVKTKEFTLYVAGEEVNKNLNFSWIKARKIVCGEKKIEAVSLEYGNCIFFMENPERVDDISRAIFDSLIFNEDGDSYDTQQYEYDKEIQEDIFRIKGAYNKGSLLEGLKVTGLDIRGITNISFRGKCMKVTFKGGKTEAVKLIAA